MIEYVAVATEYKYDKPVKVHIIDEDNREAIFTGRRNVGVQVMNRGNAEMYKSTIENNVQLR